MCVGIDSYKHIDDLHGCVNDANSVKSALERHGDGTFNFDVKLMSATSETSYITRNELKDAIEENGHGVYTSLLVEALYGGAMNLLGDVSPGSIYSYIDRALGAWEPRPVFKANINGFVSLRKNSPPISILELSKITEIFNSPYDEYKLDPTYEPDKHEADIKDVNKEHESIFAILQRYVKLNLVIPVDEEHMYYAAIHHKSCKLTAQGQHYWNLFKKR